MKHRKGASCTQVPSAVAPCLHPAPFTSAAGCLSGNMCQQLGQHYSAQHGGLQDGFLGAEEQLGKRAPDNRAPCPRLLGHSQRGEGEQHPTVARPGPWRMVCRLSILGQVLRVLQTGPSKCAGAAQQSFAQANLSPGELSPGHQAGCAQGKQTQKCKEAHFRLWFLIQPGKREKGQKGPLRPSRNKARMLLKWPWRLQSSLL